VDGAGWQGVYHELTNDQGPVGPGEARRAGTWPRPMTGWSLQRSSARCPSAPARLSPRPRQPFDLRLAAARCGRRHRAGCFRRGPT